MDVTGKAPAPLWIIALLALAPFPVAAVAYSYGTPLEAAFALQVLLTWSAIIMAFLGGVRWGLETNRAQPRWTRLAATVISPVTAWILFLARDVIPVHWQLMGYLIVFLLQWLFDQTVPEAPTRWPRLMTVLTLGAGMSLAMALEKALRL